jgi:hypothetical protein
MWQPNRAQWLVIWSVYVLVILVTVDWTQRSLERRPPTVDEALSESLLKLEENVQQDPFKKVEIRRKLTWSETGRDHYVKRFDPSVDTASVILLLLAGGLLTVWRLQDRARQPENATELAPPTKKDRNTS